LGLAVLIILRFVLFEPRKSSKTFLKISLIVLIFLSGAFFFNFFLGFLTQLIHMNLVGIILPLIICISSILYFTLIILKKPFKALNARLISRMEQWSSRGSRMRLKKHFIPIISICWLLFTTIALFIPYPYYSQKSPTSIEGQRIGIWVGFNTDLSNETMQMFADADVYFVTSGKIASLGPTLANWLNRCRDFGIEVHFSLSATPVGIYHYVNLWTIEGLMNDTEVILEWFNTSNFLGDPITTVVYDMEGVVNLNFVQYFFDRPTLDKLTDYYTIQQEFKELNQHIREDYNLTVQICGEFVQGFDFQDADDDITSLYGLLNDDQATMSYMIYRKDFFELNYVIDSMRFFDKGDTIIINSWKFAGTRCWKDIDCVIEEAQLVLGYPEKKYNLELWRIDNFMDSYGLEGLHNFIAALTSDPSTWADIHVWHMGPFAEYLDLSCILYSILDLYSPLIKAIFRAY
jgi:hypothetical protein